jgi:hypothetical protein
MNGTFQDPGMISVTTAATSGEGCSVFKGGGANASGVLGAIGNNAGWEFDAWLETGATITNYAVRCGFMKGGQQASDAPASGMWVEYDTANASSDTDWTFVTSSASTRTYSASSVVPGASTFYHFRIGSTSAGTINFQIGSANGSLSSITSISSNVDTTDNMSPFFQVLPRSNSAVVLNMDRISYYSATGPSVMILELGTLTPHRYSDLRIRDLFEEGYKKLIAQVLPADKDFFVSKNFIVTGTKSADAAVHFVMERVLAADSIEADAPEKHTDSVQELSQWVESAKEQIIRPNLSGCNVKTLPAPSELGSAIREYAQVLQDIANLVNQEYEAQERL